MTAYSIIVSPDAEKDIQTAIDYYDSFSTKIGEKFFDSLVSDIDLLQSYGLAFQVRYDSIRLIHLKGFPYSVHYSIYEESKIIVIEALRPQKMKNNSLK